MKNKEYKYHITLINGKILAEVYYEDKTGNFVHEILLINKWFKRFLRPVAEIDYKRAKEWAENQIKWLKNANNQI